MTVRICAPLQADSAQGIAFLAHLTDRPTVDRVLRRATDEQRERVPGLVEQARERGYATSASVLPGVAAIAAPALDGTGQVAATVALVAATSVLEGPTFEPLADALRATAGDLPRQLGHAQQ